MIYTFMTRKADGFINQKVTFNMPDDEQNVNELLKNVAIGLFRAEKNRVCEVFFDRVPKGDCYGSPAYYLYQDKDESFVFSQDKP